MVLRTADRQGMCQKLNTHTNGVTLTPLGEKVTPFFYARRKGGAAGMYFTKGKQRAFELLMQQKPGFDRYQSGCAGDDEDCGTCRFYRPQWKYEFCVFKECLYCPGKRTRKTHASMDK